MCECISVTVPPPSVLPQHRAVSCFLCVTLSSFSECCGSPLVTLQKVYPVNKYLTDFECGFLSELILGDGESLVRLSTGPSGQVYFANMSVLQHNRWNWRKVFVTTSESRRKTKVLISTFRSAFQALKPPKM